MIFLHAYDGVILIYTGSYELEIRDSVLRLNALPGNLSRTEYVRVVRHLGFERIT